MATMTEQEVSRGHRVALTRVIRASRARVFAAWTTDEGMRAWFAPGQMTIGYASFDLRVGGAYRIEMEGTRAAATADGDKPIGPPVSAHGVYREIVPDTRLVYTWIGSWVPEEESLVTVELRDVEGGTELTLIHEGFHTEQSAMGHRSGWESTLGKLEQELARG